VAHGYRLGDGGCQSVESKAGPGPARARMLTLPSQHLTEGNPGPSRTSTNQSAGTEIFLTVLMA